MIKLCDIGDLSPGTSVRIEASGEIPVPLCLVNVEGEFFCLIDMCSHRQALLSGGAVVGFEVQCPKHFSRFDVRTGQPDDLPARDNVATFEVSVIDGGVYIDLSTFKDIGDPTAYDEPPEAKSGHLAG